jgi:hypothetical protein
MNPKLKFFVLLICLSLAVSLWAALGLSVVKASSIGDNTIQSTPDFKTAWDFRYGLQGWTANSSLLFSETGFQGVVFGVTGQDPFIEGPQLAGVLAKDYPYLYVKMASQTDTCGQIYFQRAGDAGFADARSINFNVTPSGGDLHIVIDMRQNPNWIGTITRLRIDPACGPATGMANAVRLDYIALTGNFASWDFSNGLNGWTLVNGLINPDPASPPYGLVMTVSADDPFMHGPYMRLNAADYPYLFIQMASQTDNCAQIFFRKPGQPDFQEEQYLPVPIVADGQTKFLLVNMSENPHWSGVIEQLRLDPACFRANANAVRIDRIGLVSRKTGWDFVNGLQGWSVERGLIEPDGNNDVGVVFKVSDNDPFISGPWMALPAHQFPFITIKMASVTHACGQLYFQRAGDVSFDDSRKVDLNFNADGSDQFLVLNMRQHPNWTGTIIRLRLDPACDPVGDSFVRIDRLNLVPLVYLPVVRR